jgi:hypothetical protein
MPLYLDQVNDETSLFVTATTMTLTSTTSPNCDVSTQIQLSNNNCLSKIDLQV